MALTDKNLYAYCDNNPVVREDGDGEFWNILIGAGVGAAVGGAVSFFSQLFDEEAPSINSAEFWAHVAVAAATGFVSGGLAASGVGIVGQVAVNSALGAMGSVADTAIDSNGNASVGTYLLRAAEGATIGAISGVFGGKGSASKHVSNHFRRMLRSGLGNFKYYYSQIKIQSIRDGFKAIPGIIKSYIPSVTKSTFQICCK